MAKTWDKPSAGELYVTEDTKPMDIIDRLQGGDINIDRLSDRDINALNDAIAEIKRLRQENEQLRERVNRLQQWKDLIEMIQTGSTSAAYNPAWREF